MCGIVGAISPRNVTPILLEGLKRLEYRGYDSAGVAVIHQNRLQREREIGKVAGLEAKLQSSELSGQIGIAHTRWATHGKPSVDNAHPQMSGTDVAVVHNGIIENHERLRDQLAAHGYVFASDTDTEVVAHLFHYHYQLVNTEPNDERLIRAFRETLEALQGAYALSILHTEHPGALLCAKVGSPLVIGEGSEEHFIGSDPLALLQVTDRFIYLEEGDYALVTRDEKRIYSLSESGMVEVERPIVRYEHGDHAADRGEFRHFMLKEIHEQPRALRDSLAGKFGQAGELLASSLGPNAENILRCVKQVQIVSCGTSYHAGLVARYWLEALAGVPCSVEVASEFRYRQVVVPENTLFVTISQSGETADTLAALRFAKTKGYLASLAICNVPGSSLVRESDYRLLTNAGPEIGVASTKAFTTQLAVLLWLTAVIGQAQMPAASRVELINALRSLPDHVASVLALEPAIERLAAYFANKHHTLFLGRGTHYPVAMEGALKLKEISYIHAEAYAAGELKHGPLALVDEEMPVVTVAPSNELLEKLKSNLQEVQARGGQLINFVCEEAHFKDNDNVTNVCLPKVDDWIAPIVYSVPLQLLAYHVALVKGTDVDKPRNLAKSVTVE
ncbi:glutamine--fructose-6-phosphate transaminase (isomerizing) [Salinicola avicenniae]|uniref:glutamine--fructose-6-phosphate transaminase (isomerizing) n=1 Tax=Salinicola avicenniae TaxID=2916836 RepID=UPI0020732A02|nr:MULTISPECIES: glutamine--fructose-6-phosphate transaminase (isomerizing) [unclassified Salinicola]